MEWLKIEQLNAYYGQVAVLHDISFTVTQGEFLLILGANSAGKTSFLRAISGLIKTTGKIIFKDKQINTKSVHQITRLGISYVPQREGIFRQLTVLENLKLGASVCQSSSSETWDFVFQIFPILKSKLKHTANTLSGGEQHMLAIARALMQKPQLLLLDEPSDGLAPPIVKHVFELMQKINKEQKLTIILVEQNAKLALPYVKYVHLLESGRLIASGDPVAIQANDTVLKIYLGQ